jgi:hypothetical protein
VRSQCLRGRWSGGAETGLGAHATCGQIKNWFNHIKKNGWCEFFFFFFFDDDEKYGVLIKRLVSIFNKIN